MKNVYIKRPICAILAALLIVGLSGCAGKSKELTPEQADTRDALAHEFMDELRVKILPKKDDIEYIESLGVMVSNEEKVNDISAFESFAESFRAGENCSLTVVFINKSYIATRYQMQDGIGYYFRYEHDDKNDVVSVTSKVFDEIGVDVDERLGRVKFTLEYGGRNIASFIFRPQQKEE